MFKEIIPEILKIFTLLGDAAILLIIFGFFYNKINNQGRFKKIKLLFSKNYLFFGLIISLIATFGSLFYSEVIGYAPCVLCWWQRIFMYPQVLIFGFALLKKNSKIVNYSMLLSFIGGIIALYHYLIQIGTIQGSGCYVVGYSSSCSETFFLSYGYITIPMMAMTAFLLLIFLGLNLKSGNGVSN